MNTWSLLGSTHPLSVGNEQKEVCRETVPRLQPKISVHSSAHHSTAENVQSMLFTFGIFIQRKMARETFKEPKLLQSYNEKSELTIDLRATQIQECAPLKVS